MDWSRTRVLVVGPVGSPGVVSARTFLAARGARVEAVPDLAQALALLNAHPHPSTVLFFSAGDFAPEEVGPLRAIRCLHPDTLVVVGVDATSRRRAIHALRLGADAVLPEPFYQAELEAAVEALGRRSIDRAKPAEPPPAEEAESHQPASVGVDTRSASAGERAPERGGSSRMRVGGGGREGVVNPPLAPSGSPLEASGAVAGEVGTPPGVPSGASLPLTGGGEEERPTGPSATGVARRLLLVEGERFFRELLADVLRQRGYYVAEAADERQALWCLAEEGDYDLILAEVPSGGVEGGVRLVAALREAAPRSPVVLITSLLSEAEMEVLSRAGAAAIVGKPFDIERLLVVLRGALAGAPADRGGEGGNSDDLAGGHPLLSPEEVKALLDPPPPPPASQ